MGEVVDIRTWKDEKDEQRRRSEAALRVTTLINEHQLSLFDQEEPEDAA